MGPQPKHPTSAQPEATATSDCTADWSFVSHGDTGRQKMQCRVDPEALQQQGIEPIPSIRTIYRIMQRQEPDADEHD